MREAEWRARIRKRLQPANLDPLIEIAIVEELAQHAQDCYECLLAEGRSEEEAVAISWQEVDDDGLIEELKAVLRAGS